MEQNEWDFNHLFHWMPQIDSRFFEENESKTTETTNEKFSPKLCLQYRESEMVTKWLYDHLESQFLPHSYKEFKAFSESDTHAER